VAVNKVQDCQCRLACILDFTIPKDQDCLTYQKHCASGIDPPRTQLEGTIGPSRVICMMLASEVECVFNILYQPLRVECIFKPDSGYSKDEGPTCHFFVSLIPLTLKPAVLMVEILKEQRRNDNYVYTQDKRRIGKQRLKYC